MNNKIFGVDVVRFDADDIKGTIFGDLTKKLDEDLAHVMTNYLDLCKVGGVPIGFATGAMMTALCNKLVITEFGVAKLMGGNQSILDEMLKSLRVGFAEMKAKKEREGKL